MGNQKNQHKTRAIEDIRRKLISNIEEKKRLSELEVLRKPPIIRRRQGRKVTVVRPKLWWRIDASGGVATYIIFNNKQLKLNRRGTTIEVGSLEDLPETYGIVISAVKAGELDKESTRNLK